MGRPAGWMTQLTGRGPMRSPGAPSHRREVERGFWREIAKGLLAEEAAEVVGASQAVGARWFRHGGGMSPFDLKAFSGRYLTFAEREEIQRHPLASGTPGNLAGWCELVRAHGKLSLAEVFAPAIALARDGFPLGRFNVELINSSCVSLKDHGQ